MSNELTDQQQLFCREFIVDFNGKKAGIRAGMPEAGAAAQASRLLTERKVTDYIHELFTERAARTDVNADRVLLELSNIGFSDLHDFIDIDGSGCLEVKDLRTVPRSKRRAIKSIKQKKRIVSGGTNKEGGEDTILESTTEIQLWDKLSAIDKIMKHLGMCQERDPGLDNDIPPADRIGAAEKQAEDILKGTVH